MKKQSFGMMFLVLTMAIMSLALASATISFSTPAAGTNHSSAISVKVYFVNKTDGITDPVTANTTVYYNTTSTAWTAVTCSSFAQNGSQATCTIAITAIPDSANVRLNVTLGNNTNVLGGIVSGAITIDDTAPTISVLKTSIAKGEILKYKTADNIGFGSCTMTNPSGHPTSSASLTTSGSDYSDYTDTAYLGAYTITCTDYTGNSATQAITVADAGGIIVTTGSTGTGSSPTGTSNNNQNVFIIIIIGIAAYLLMKKK